MNRSNTISTRAGVDGVAIHPLTDVDSARVGLFHGTTMKTYYVRNVRKAAELELAEAKQEAFYDEDMKLVLTLRSGIDGSFVKDSKYKTVSGLLRNAGRKVLARFTFVPAAESVSGGARSSRVRFEATF